MSTLADAGSKSGHFAVCAPSITKEESELGGGGVHAFNLSTEVAEAGGFL